MGAPRYRKNGFNYSYDLTNFLAYECKVNDPIVAGSGGGVRSRVHRSRSKTLEPAGILKLFVWHVEITDAKNWDLQQMLEHENLI